MRRARGESGVAAIVTRYLACAASQQNAEPLLLRAQFVEPFERRIDLLRGQWRHSALRQSRAGSGEETELGGAFDPCVDFTAQGAEVDRLGQKRLGAALKRLALGFRIAVGSDHDDWDVRPQGLRLA